MDVSQPDSVTVDQEAPEITKLKQKIKVIPETSLIIVQPKRSCAGHQRHFKALMRKNAINWRRTPFGSLMEILCPILLMCLLVWARTIVTDSLVGDFDIYQLKRPLYPTSSLKDDGQWTNDNYFATKDGIDLLPFMQHTNHSAVFEIDNTTEVYSPLLDPLSPYFFLPPHCYNNLNSYDSPLIAYVYQGNQIESDMVEQLTQLFEKQKQLLAYTNNLTNVLQDPQSDDQAFAVIMQSLEGGTQEQKIDILRVYGVPNEMIGVYEFANSLTPLSLQVNQTQQQELIELINNQQLLMSSSDFNQTQIEQLLNNQTLDDGDGGLSQIIQLSQQSEMQTIAQLQQLIQGNITLNQFETSTNQSLKQVSQSLNLNNSQFQQLNQTVIQLSNQTDLELILQRNNVDPGLVNQLLKIVTDLIQPGQEEEVDINQLLSQPSLDLIADAFQLDPQQIQLLQSISKIIDRANITTQTQSTPAVSTNEFQKYFNDTQITKLGDFKLQQFESNQHLDQYIQSEDYGSQSKEAVCFGFKIIEHSNRSYELELFFNDLWPEHSQSIPNQKLDPADSTVKYAKIKEYNQYLLNGYSLMQNWVANTILRRKTISDAQITAMVVPTKLKPARIDYFNLLLQPMLTLFILLMYVPILYRTVFRIVLEKVTKTQESMRIMGMTELPYWASWFAYYTIVNSVLVLCCWAILNLSNIVSHKSAGILFLWMWVYGQSLFGLILLIQSLFSAPRSAAITTTMVYFGITILTLLIDDEDTSRSAKCTLCCLFPTLAMTQTVVTFLRYDGASGLGVTLETWDLQYQNFSVRDGVILMCVSGAIVFVLGVYLEAVLPKTYGQKKHPCFFLKCCCQKLRKKLRVKTAKVSNLDDFDQFETQYLQKDCYEPVPSDIKKKELEGKILKITDLRKQYENGFQAVDGVNLKIYSDQIFVLLGHNGAGKTTTMNMLTGLITSSPGSTAEIFGVNIFENMKDVRRFIGVCPQHDILFELLTTEEHLSFFYDLKGANPDPKTKQAQIQKIMSDIGILDKRNVLAYQLSGGYKRKLSVAIALIGDSKFVLLDEPTSGMDLQSRRQLWNMLKEYKKDRIIVLTTHYMDEADILSDRIAIMSKGRVACLGSSMFLKDKFGAGYNLTIVKIDKVQSNYLLLEYLERQLGDQIKLLSEVQAELTIQIPQEYSTKFQFFFTNFDTDLNELGVESYGISLSTLEEVFLKIGEMNPVTVVDSPQFESIKSEVSALNISETQMFPITRKSRQPDSFSLREDNCKDLDESFLNCLVAVLYKRYSNYKRNRRAILNEVILPSLIMVIGFSLALYTPSLRSPSRLQTLDRLPLPQTLIINTENSNLSQNLPSGFQLQPTNLTEFDEFGDYVFQNGGRTEPPYSYGAYQIYEADTQRQQYQFVSFINITSQDSTGLYPHFMYEAILKTATQDPEFTFQVRSTPYPPTIEAKDRLASFSAVIIIFITSIGYSVLITSIVSYLVVERKEGLKHLQVISGMKLKAYWVGNFIVDFIKMQLTIGVTIALFFGYGMGMDSAYVTYLVLPFGILPFTYVTSFVFSVDSAAQTFTMFFHFLTLAIFSSVIFMLRVSPQQEIVGDYLNFVLKVVPTYPLTSSVICDAQCSQIYSTRQKQNDGNGLTLSPDVWAFQNNLSDIIIMFIHLFVWTIVLIVIEKNQCRRCRLKQPKTLEKDTVIDTDVENEAHRIKDENHEPDTIQVKGFRKDFQVQQQCGTTTLTAVGNLSFSLKAGECFALLGVNGSGKSTTFKSLTGQQKPTSGVIKIGGFNIATQFDKARKLIGYCPQSNLIFDSMSVEEHIWYYARIKGIPQKERAILVEQTIKQLGLEDHRKKTAGTLSGGYRRKVCVAQALVGNPPIILLDEPSAGMDPESRRFMWSIISNTKSSAVLLTTHNMEEAEALSTKMGIMVDRGKLKCYGSSQHIKSKYGTGFIIQLKIKQISESDLLHSVQQFLNPDGLINLQASTVFDEKIINEITTKIEQNVQTVDMYKQLHSQVSLHNCIDALLEYFPEVDLLEQYGDYMKLRVMEGQSLGHVFGLVEKLKIQHDVCSYGVEQTSLEQIFQVFADKHYYQKVTKFVREYCDDPQFSNYHILTIKSN